MKEAGVNRPFDYLARTPSRHAGSHQDRESKDLVVSDEQVGSASLQVAGIPTLRAFLVVKVESVLRDPDLVRRRSIHEK